MSGKNDNYLKEVNNFVGNKVMTRRLFLGLSRADISKEINVTIQQIFKYESGLNNMSLGRYLLVCKALKVPFEYFIGSFEDNLEYNLEERLILENLPFVKNTFKSILKIKDKNKKIRIINSLVKIILENEIVS